jgi:uncharacterized protein
VIPLTHAADGVAFAVRVTPRAGRTAVAGERADALLVRLAAAPVDGAANDALVDLLARLFECRRADITILSGERTRDKRVRVGGAAAARVEAKLSDILRQ